MGNAFNTHFLAMGVKRRYPQYGINKRNRISLFCCFENATVAFGRAVDKNLLDGQTDKIDTSYSTFS